MHLKLRVAAQPQRWAAARIQRASRQKLNNEIISLSWSRSAPGLSALSADRLTAGTQHEIASMSAVKQVEEEGSGRH